MAKKNDAVNLEKSITELESIVEKMESGDLSLEESLKQFEAGITLTRACQKTLAEAELKVEKLVSSSSTETEPFQLSAADMQE